MAFLNRLLRHLFASTYATKKIFTQSSLRKIEDAIAKSEISHSGQIRFIVETSLSPHALFHRQTPRERALEVFSLFRIWDTANNNGVLIYLLMADHDFEIIADRNIHQLAGDTFWKMVADEMTALLQNNKFEEGVLHGIERIHQVLKEHFSADVITPNELPDAPIII
jgi:uncharacterized membrane protein